jgi:hypothetical protein
MRDHEAKIIHERVGDEKPAPAVILKPDLRAVLVAAARIGTTPVAATATRGGLVRIGATQPVHAVEKRHARVRRGRIDFKRGHGHRQASQHADAAAVDHFSFHADSKIKGG